MRTTIVLCALLSGCLGSPSGDDLAVSSTTRISDAVHEEGRRGFFFLPPVVARPDPEGIFDGLRNPSVLIRELGSDVVIAAFTMGEGSDAIRVDLDAEAYAVNWHTGDYNLDPMRTYRIEVHLEGQVLGFADVDVVSGGRELRNVDSGNFIPLLDGRTLPIGFRIEAGTLCSADAADCIVRVPGDAATIQEAVDRAADQALVVLAPGIYEESVEIVGKSVHIRGDTAGGREGAQLVQPVRTSEVRVADARGVIHFGRDSGGRLENLTVIGGDAGLRAEPGVGVGDLLVKDVTLFLNGYGVLGSWPSLTLEDVLIDSSLHNGYQTCGGDQEITASIIQEAGGAGIFAANCSDTPTNLAIDVSFVQGNAGGGAIILGNVHLGISNSFFTQNHSANVFMRLVDDALIVNSTFANAVEADFGGLEGLADGIIASGSSGFMLACDIVGNPRVGLLLHDTSFALLEVSILGEEYGLVVQGDASWTDLGSNLISGDTPIFVDGTLPVPEPPSPDP